MLRAITLLLVLQLIGEVIVAAADLPIPGPVVGMALLFAGLLVRGSIPDDLDRVGRGLLGNLSLLFVPAGVGVILYLPLVAQQWLPILVATVFGTALAIGLTALFMSAMLRLTGQSESSHTDDAR